MFDAVLGLFTITVVALTIVGLLSPDNIPNDEEYEILKRTVVIKKEVLIKNNLATYNKDTGEFVLMIGE